MKGLLQAIALLAVSGVCAVGSFFLHPAAPDLFLANDEIDFERVESFDLVMWIDARDEADFLSEHLEGALLLNEDDWETQFANFIGQWNPDATIVVYCSSSACLRSQQVASRLREELGIDEVFVLKGGWQSLQKAGLVSN